MTTKRQNIENLAIAEKPLYFHIGRFGKYHFFGIKPFYELADTEIKYRGASVSNKDERGRFCKPYLVRDADNRVLSEDDVDGLYGKINKDFDMEFNTDIVISVEDIKGNYIYEKLIKEAYKYDYIDEEIVKYLNLKVEEPEWKKIMKEKMKNSKEKILKEQAEKIESVINVLSAQFGKDFKDEVNYMKMVKKSLKIASAE